MGFTFTALGTVPAERLVALSLRAMVLGSWGVTILTHTLPGSDVNVTEDETCFWRCQIIIIIIIIIIIN